MRRIPSLLRQPGFHLLLFLVALILFTRPVLLMPKMEPPGTVMASFFLPWGLVILVLFFVSRSYRE